MIAFFWFTRRKIVDFVKQFAESSDTNVESVDLERRVNHVKEMLALRDFCVLGFFEKEDDPRAKELDQAPSQRTQEHRNLVEQAFPSHD